MTDYSLERTLADWRRLRQMWLEDDEEPADIGDDSVAIRCYREGEAAFLACLDHQREDNPYQHLKGSAWEQRCPWYWGYRAAAQRYYNERHRLDEMQSRIRAIVEEHGMELVYEDEYHMPYARTPEGWNCNLA